MPAPSEERSEHGAFDCVIVGAGFSGVAAMYHLHRRHQVHNVLILEAQDRVGGRVHSAATGTNDDDGGLTGEVVEHGGQWIGPQQTAINLLVKELGLHTVKQYTSGRSILDYQPNSDGFASMVHTRVNRPLAYKGVIPPLPIHALVDLQLAIWRIDRLAWQVPLERPWEATKAKQWDSMTVHTFFEQTLWTRAAMDMLLGFVQVVFCAEASEVSLLHFLWIVHSCSGVEALMNSDDGAQNFRIKGGAARIALEMLNRVQRGDSKDKKVLLNKPVTAIDQTDADVVKVTVKDGTVYRAKRVVLALPPPMISHIRFEPSMPPHREQIGQRMPMGTIIKTNIMFKSAFWRDKGFSGFFVSNSGVLQFGFDMTTRHGIVGFIVGAQARSVALLSKNRRHEMIVEQLAFLFSCSVDYVQQELLAIEETNWTEVEYIRGAYFAYAPPGVMTTVGFQRLRDPVGRVHFAGTETAIQHSGYMSGALESGFRAATEVAEALAQEEQQTSGTAS